jgi:hypothetical protein
MKLWYVTAAVSPGKGDRERKTRVWRWAVIAETDTEAVGKVRNELAPQQNERATWSASEDGFGYIGLGVYLR